MRVITGLAGGRKLKSPDGDAVRPTADQVKQAIFNILQFDVEGRRVLDLFGGTGQMGIEALSRGAKEAVFIDASRTSAALIRENLKICGMKAAVLQTDALQYLSRGERFDIIFVDPPYDAGLYGTQVLPDMRPPYRLLKERKYGSVKIAVFTKESI